MSLAAAMKDEDGAMHGRERERRCIVSGEVLPEAKLIRFVVGPDGDLTPDLAAKLPGRGIWVGASSATLATAIAKNLFAKAAKQAVRIPPDLAARVPALIVQRMQSDLGMALRSGQLVLGFDQVQRALQGTEPPVPVLEASDGAADGKRKLFAISHARGLKVQTIECLTSAELSVAVGRENVIHAALKSGRLQERLSKDAERLSGFRSVTMPASPHERDA